MSYITPKTTWVNLDIPVEVDFNRIEGNIAFLKTVTDGNSANITTLEGLVDALQISTGGTSTDLQNLTIRVTDLEDDYIALDGRVFTLEMAGFATEGYVDAAVAGITVDAEAIRKNSTLGLRVEVRTTDPVSPEIGRIWLVTS